MLLLASQCSGVAGPVGDQTAGFTHHQVAGGDVLGTEGALRRTRRTRLRRSSTGRGCPHRCARRSSNDFTSPREHVRGTGRARACAGTGKPVARNRLCVADGRSRATVSSTNAPPPAERVEHVAEHRCVDRAPTFAGVLRPLRARPIRRRRRSRARSSRCRRAGRRTSRDPNECRRSLHRRSRCRARAVRAWRAPPARFADVGRTHPVAGRLFPWISARERKCSSTTALPARAASHAASRNRSCSRSLTAGPPRCANTSSRSDIGAAGC